MNYKRIAEDYFKQTCDLIEFESRDEWLRLRMKGIGGSDVSGIMGHSSYNNRKDIYHSKIVLQPEQINDYIEFGRTFEPIIADIFEAKYKNVYAVLDFKNIMFRNIFVPYFQASLDRVLVEKATNDVGILEIKTAQERKSKWYYEDGSKGIPQPYIDQAVHYFMTTNAKFVIFYVLINHQGDYYDKDIEFLKPRRINREDVLEYMQEVESECIDFWENYVKKGIEPKNRITF